MLDRRQISAKTETPLQRPFDRLQPRLQMLRPISTFTTETISPVIASSASCSSPDSANGPGTSRETMMLCSATEQNVRVAPAQRG